MLVIDFKAPPGASAGVTGWRTKRICVPAARSMLADMIANQAEADQAKASLAASLRETL